MGISSGLVKKEKPISPAKEMSSEPTTIIQHYASIHYKPYKVQPKDDMGKIVNYMKKIGHAKLYSTKQLLEYLSSGHCVLLSNFEVVDRVNNHKGNIRFISASAFAIDVDDDNKATNPLQVLEGLKEICVGLFYTFSHGKKGNRYRLFFQLDQSLTDQQDFTDLIEYMIHYLQEKGLPVDEGAKSPTQIIRPGILGYELNDLTTTLSVNEWLPKAKLRAQAKREILEAERKERAEKFKDTLYQPATFEELEEACTAIGYIPSDGTEETRKKWLDIVYALKYEVLMGNLDEQQGYELYSIISGSEANERYWRSIKPHGRVKIGTLFHYAKQAGYKRKHKYQYALTEVQETIPHEQIKVKEYLTIEVAKDLIQRKQRLLVDSPTGSRKTSSFMGAYKELANRKWHYYIFSAPTIPLTEQIAKDHNVPCAKGGMKNLKNEMVNKALAGERVFVTTYDKTKELVECLSSGIDYAWEQEKPEFTIVIDEFHKFTEAYNYRFNAIDQLDELTNTAVSVIGLSGTPEDILKDHFDSLIKIETGNSSSPCWNYWAFTYDKKNDADVMLLPVLQSLLEQTRVLLFINNKKRIKRVAEILRKEGIKAQIITSSNKKSPTYLDIVEHGTIDDSVQVVITTTVLADGVSIENKLDWSCLVVADMASPIFNPSAIKQISNRFRGEYRYFALYMQKVNPKFTDTNRFNVEAEYRYRKNIVGQYVDYLNNEFEAEQLQDFIPSLVERNNGIFYRSTEADAVIEYNPLFIRHQSMKRKETYYSIFRNAFIEEVSRQIGLTCKGVFNVNEAVENKNIDLSSLLEDIEAEKEQEKRENDELRDAFKVCFDELMYKCFISDDKESLEGFKTQVHPDQYVAIQKICTIADFETCKKVGLSVRKKADRYKYYNDIKALVDIATFDYVKKTNVTKRAFIELLKMTNEDYLTKDFKEITEKILPKKMKVKPEDVKKALNLFHKSSGKQGGKGFTRIEPLNIQLVAKVRHKPPAKELEAGQAHFIDETAVKNSVLRYVWQQSPHNQKNMLPAIAEKWGIESYEKPFFVVGESL